MQVEIDTAALNQAVLDSAEVKGYNADSPTMAEKSSSVHRFIVDLLNKVIGGKS